MTKNLSNSRTNPAKKISRHAVSATQCSPSQHLAAVYIRKNPDKTAPTRGISKHITTNNFPKISEDFEKSSEGRSNVWDHFFFNSEDWLGIFKGICNGKVMIWSDQNCKLVSFHLVHIYVIFFHCFCQSRFKSFEKTILALINMTFINYILHVRV